MEESNGEWRQGFHLMPPIGWLNDPNGLAQFHGLYHVFFQYWPGYPDGAERGWGHYVSSDLVDWEFRGIAIHPDTADDAGGAYSGSGVVADGTLALLYTGNVKLPGDHDYISSGRLANEILVTSADGGHLSEKRTVMRNADYPACCSCHVRDPKVWDEDGAWHMLLGARDRDDEGFAMVYDAPGDTLADLAHWTLRHQIRSQAPFGYMWECPDRIALLGHEFLSCCPQGLPSEAYRWQNVYQAGYFALDGSLLDAESVDETTFREWDRGFDFYAPQSFTDDSGRTILIGWMGLPDIDYANPTMEAEGWVHCMTVPRELSLDETGTIVRQSPVAELDSQRGAQASLVCGTSLAIAEGRADIVCSRGLDEGAALSLGTGENPEALELAFAGGLLTLAFPGSAGAGRDIRRVRLDEVRDLRVLVDRSSVEVFANDGETVLSTRWYPQGIDAGLLVTLTGNEERGEARAWPMSDAMHTTIAAALAASE
ncbi:MAG: glycoside hydrolase family 32 protein [Atopobiaceae bacterium]|jgi:beta-fructofuranosidase|nr:glycoside hydrolase family 32 protein [Atopobiaceae bacterium]